MFDMAIKHFSIKVLTYLLAAIALGMIFTAYFAPETMVAITNQVWTLCGW
jgi:hypothetical protein